MDFTAFRAALLAGERAQENLVVFESTDSTNRAGRRVVAELQKDYSPLRPTLLAAWHQTAGRGRHARRWHSPPGKGIYATVLMDVARDAVSTLPIAVAVALAEELAGHTRQAVQLKWPNDLYVGGRKIGGILIEVVSEDEDSLAAVIGFGVNHGLDEDELPLAAATSLRLECERLPEMPPLLLSLAERVHRCVDSGAPIPELVDRYRGLCLHGAGDEIVFRLGEEKVQGRFVGLNDHGWLTLETGSGERTFAAGEVVEGAGAPSGDE
jgi:BirA family biotin operon repressor/biotin-[acetyl-CoA-carboxylase] ligase